MKFSIIIPVYNVKNYIDECLKSVLMQSYSDYEVILVDDGSTDQSGIICDKYSLQYSFIRTIHQKNGGLSAARNTGIAACDGDFFILLDSDDKLLYASALEELNNVTQNNDLVVFDVNEFIDGGDRFIGSYSSTSGLEKQYENGIQFLLDALDKKPQYRWYACLYAYRTAFWRANCFKFPVGKKYEDMATTHNVLLLSNGISVYDKKIYGYRRERIGAITATYNYKNQSDKLLLLENNIKQTEKLDISDKLKLKLCSNWSIAYFGLYIQASMMNKEDFNNFVLLLEEKKWIGKYAADKKYKFVRLIDTLFGTKQLVRVLAIRRKIRKRENIFL